MFIEKPLRVGKRERYEVDLNNWLDGEALVSATVEPDAKATISGAPDLTSGVIGFFIEGAERGSCAVHLNYSTATRTDCYTVFINVTNC